MRGVFKSLFLLLLIVGIFFALSFVVNVSAKVTHTSVVKNVVPNVNVWNPWPPPVKKEKGGDGIAGNVWNPWPPPVKKEKGGGGVTMLNSVGGSVWNPWPPPVKKEKGGDGLN